MHALMFSLEAFTVMVSVAFRAVGYLLTAFVAGHLVGYVVVLVFNVVVWVD
jgi:hypothetical protein